MDNGPHGPAGISLVRMAQQANVACSQEDWTGVSNPGARRRLQNRINQRAYRKLLHTAHHHRTQTAGSNRGLTATGRRKTAQSEGQGPQVRTGSRRENHRSCAAELQNSQTDDSTSLEKELWKLFRSAITTTKLKLSDLPRAAQICRWSVAQSDRTIQEFEKWAMQNNRPLYGPTTDHLLVLIKFNILRALVTNMHMLGITEEFTEEDDAISPFVISSDQMRTAELPRALRGTKLQMEVPHHPWIDIIPVPRMRDNLIRAGGTFDDMELCGDLVGFFSGSRMEKGMIIWGEPWDIGAWEVTEQFLQRWGWAIRGCHELFESTNRWRAAREEDPIDFSPFECEEVE